ncbi:MAG: CopG family transcriptional regulator [Bryobacteraceae bacterium]|jgi:hypothetical protein
MRTTLDLDENLVQIARQLAQQRGMTIGRVVSELALESLEPKASAKLRNGVPLFAPRSGTRKPHLKLVNELRDES